MTNTKTQNSVQPSRHPSKTTNGHQQGTRKPGDTIPPPKSYDPREPSFLIWQVRKFMVMLADDDEIRKNFAAIVKVDTGGKILLMTPDELQGIKAPGTGG